jgi:hypothetical protein
VSTIKAAQVSHKIIPSAAKIKVTTDNPQSNAMKIRTFLSLATFSAININEVLFSENAFY